MRVVWSREADEDLLNIWDYLVSEASAAIADEQIRKIVQVCQRLLAWPQSGPPRDSIIPGMRSIVVRPYLIFYRLSDETVQIVRVLHGRRDIEAVFVDEP